jgi:hypothetical protein
MPTICAKCKHVRLNRFLSLTTLVCACGVDEDSLVNQITGQADYGSLPYCCERRGSHNPTADCPDYAPAPEGD